MEHRPVLSKDKSGLGGQAITRWRPGICLYLQVCACAHVHALLPQLDCKPSEDKDPAQFTLVLSPEMLLPEETLTRC